MQIALVTKDLGGIQLSYAAMRFYAAEKNYRLISSNHYNTYEIDETCAIPMQISDECFHKMNQFETYIYSKSGIPRNDLALIKTIEKFQGHDKLTTFNTAAIDIVEIPDDTTWEIMNEWDGVECIEYLKVNGVILDEISGGHNPGLDVL